MYSMIEDDADFKHNPTLVNAFRAAERVYCQRQKTGYQQGGWFARAIRTVIQPSEAESIEAWERFHSEWKALVETSDLMNLSYEEEEAGLVEVLMLEGPKKGEVIKMNPMSLSLVAEQEPLK